MTDEKTDFEKWQSFHSLKSTKKARDEFKILEKVRDKYFSAKVARQNNCFWDAFTDSDTGSQSGGGDWGKRWDKQEKSAIMWYQPSDVDTFESNVKSPMVRGRINAFTNQFKKLNLSWDAKPNNEDDTNAARVASKVMDYWFQSTGSKTELLKVAEDAATHGSALLRVYFVEKKQKCSFPKDPSKMTKKEKKELEDGKLLFNDPEEITRFRDVVIEHVPIRELYPDPQSRCLHGAAYEARYVCRRRFIQIDDFKAMYKGNPNAMNVEAIKPIAEYNEFDYNFFKPPEEVIDKQSVEIIEYENQHDDEYIVMANDRIVLDMPLPYNHKEISYHKVDFVKFPGQFYGIGIPDLLMNIQGAEEILTNMMYDYIYRSYNLKYFVDATSFGELSEDLIRAESKIIPINLNDGKSIGQKVQQLESSPIGFDAFKMYDITERSATLATQIDPTQMSLMARGQTATANVLNKEQLESMIGGVVTNFVEEGLLSAGKQAWKLMQQHYSEPYVIKIVGEEKKPIYRKIRLEGIEVEMEEDTGEMIFKDIGKNYSFFELKQKFLNTKEELDIMIRPDSTEIQSRGIEMQRMSEDFAQLIQFAVDPANSEQMRQHQMPMVDAPKLFQKYFDVKRLPEDLLINKETREEADMDEAEDHIRAIYRGEKVVGMPGKSQVHVKYEAKVLIALRNQIEDLKMQMEKEMQSQEEEIMQKVRMGQIPVFNPMTGQPIPLPKPEPNVQLEEQINKKTEIANNLEEHIAAESLPGDLIDEFAQELGQAQQPQQPQQQPPQQQNPQQPMKAPMPPGGIGIAGMAGAGMPVQGSSPNEPVQDEFPGIPPSMAYFAGG